MVEFDAMGVSTRMRLLEREPVARPNAVGEDALDPHDAGRQFPGDGRPLSDA